MDRAAFLAYIDDFNAGDPARLIAHYAPDAVFENYGHRQEGEAAFAFFGWLAERVRSRLAVRELIVEDGRIAMDADMKVTALVDAPDLPIGAMRAGERRTARTFAFYDTDGPLIQHVRLAGWPPA